MPAKYVFPGVMPFVESAAIAAGVPGPDVAPLRSLWHLARVQDALGQLARVEPSARIDILRHVKGHRDALEAALKGADEAAAHAVAGLMLDKVQLDGLVVDADGSAEPSVILPGVDEIIPPEPEAHDADGHDESDA